MLCENVERYLNVAKGAPFFYVVGDDNYKQVLSELKQYGVIVDRISDLCLKDDKFPSIDDVIDHFRTLDTDCNKNRHVLIGLGEYLAIKGTVYAEKVLRRLDKTTLGTARVILLLRCVAQQVRSLQADDNRILEQRRLFIEDDTSTSITITCVNSDFFCNKVVNGVKSLLHELEDDSAKDICVLTGLDFSKAFISINNITSSFSAIKFLLKSKKYKINFIENMGAVQQWDRLQEELIKNNSSLEELFSHYEYPKNFEDDIYDKCAGLEFKNWLFFIYLKQNCSNIANEYLRMVVEKTDRCENFKRNLLAEIINIPRTDRNYRKLYNERKRLIKDFPDSEIAGFLRENQVDQTECIYRYTDNTKVEREAIISWISKHGYVAEIDGIYPDLSYYLSDYLFNCGKISSDLTEYFKQYRLMKIANTVTSDFLSLVENNSRRLLYTQLETRDSAIMSIQDKQNAFLCWVDALGVEYLPYIVKLSKNNGLSIQVKITYVELPTITSINKKFYDNWEGKKEKESGLDEIKHKDKGDFSCEPGCAPVHLASELQIIKSIIQKAATELKLHTCKTFVIASDHGASRLAVITPQKEKYETDTKGEHAGRFCKDNPNAENIQAVRENGYLVLTNYARFKNSRAANVEVHGGATLEEVVVPVITLSLKQQEDVVIKIINTDAIYCDRRNGTSIEFYISDISNTQNISIVINERRYKAKYIDNNRYEVNMHDIRHAKQNIYASIYDGDNIIGTVKFDVKGKLASVNSDFDDLF